METSTPSQNRLLPRERRRQPRIDTNERSSTHGHSRRLRPLPRTIDYLVVNSVERFVDWIDRGIIVSIDTLENLLANEPSSPTSQGSTSQVSNNDAVDILIVTNPQRPCTTTTEESTQHSFEVLDYVERFVDWIDFGITGILDMCVELEYDFQGSTSQVSNDSVVEIPTAATDLQKPCTTTVEESQEIVTPTLEMPVDISPEIHESFVSETYESCLAEHTDVTESTIAKEKFGEASLRNAAASEELAPPRDDVKDDDEWIVVEDEL